MRIDRMNVENMLGQIETNSGYARQIRGLFTHGRCSCAGSLRQRHSLAAGIPESIANQSAVRTITSTNEIMNAEQEASPGRDYRKLREAEVVLAHGATTAEACRRIGVTEQTYYR